MKKWIWILIMLYMLASTAYAMEVRFYVQDLSFNQPEGFDCTQNDSEAIEFYNNDTGATIRVGLFTASGYDIDGFMNHSDELIPISNIEHKSKHEIKGIPYLLIEYRDSYKGNSICGRYLAFVDDKTDSVYRFNYFALRELTETDEESLDELIRSVNAPTMVKETETSDVSEQTKTREETYHTLEKGSKGEDVRILQLRLIELNYLEGNADGDFGNKTKTAVQLFQQSVGLPANGVADDETQKALFASDAPKSKMYKKLDYNELSRDPDAHMDEYYTFSGKVLQVMEEAQEDGTTLATYRIATKNNYENIVYVGYRRLQGEKRILENDNVVVYAQSRGLISYQTVMGDVLSIPGFLAESINLK